MRTCLAGGRYGGCQRPGSGGLQLRGGADQRQRGYVDGRAMGALSQVKDAMIFTFAPPPMPELGRAAGFVFFLKDNVENNPK